MFQLAWYNSFKHAFKRLTKNNPELKQNIVNTLELLQNNPNNPKLRTHRLHGKLKQYWASVVNYDCRIIFTYTTDPENAEEIIALIDIGTHEDVY